MLEHLSHNDRRKVRAWNIVCLKFPASSPVGSGQPGVRAHLVQGLPGAKLLPEERPDAGDQNLDAVSPAELARQRHPHLHSPAPRLPQVRNGTSSPSQFACFYIVFAVVTDHEWTTHNTDQRLNDESIASVLLLPPILPVPRALRHSALALPLSLSPSVQVDRFVFCHLPVSFLWFAASTLAPVA